MSGAAHMGKQLAPLSERNASVSESTLTVLMIVRNAAQTLDAAVESIQSQENVAFSFLIIDDASTDGTTAKLRRYAQTDDRIRLIVLKSWRGRGHARSLALSHVYSDYIAIADADDVSLPHRFELQARFLDDNPGTAVVSSQMYLIAKSGRLSVTRYPIGEAEIRQGLESQYAPFSHASAMFRTSAVKDVGGYCPALLRAQDLNLFLRLHQSSHKFATLNEPLVRYAQVNRQSPGWWYRFAWFAHAARLHLNCGDDRQMCEQQLASLMNGAGQLRVLRSAIHGYLVSTRLAIEMQSQLRL